MDHGQESVTERASSVETSDSCTQMRSYYTFYSVVCDAPETSIIFWRRRKWYVRCMYFKKDIFKAMATEN